MVFSPNDSNQDRDGTHEILVSHVVSCVEIVASHITPARETIPVCRDRSRFGPGYFSGAAELLLKKGARSRNNSVRAVSFAAENYCPERNFDAVLKALRA